MGKIIFAIFLSLPILLTSCTSELRNIDDSKATHKKEEAQNYATTSILGPLEKERQDLTYKYGGKISILEIERYKASKLEMQNALNRRLHRN